MSSALANLPLLRFPGCYNILALLHPVVSQFEWDLSALPTSRFCEFQSIILKLHGFTFWSIDNLSLSFSPISTPSILVLPSESPKGPAPEDKICTDLGNVLFEYRLASNRVKISIHDGRNTPR